MRKNVILFIAAIIVAMVGCSHSPKQPSAAVMLPPNPTAMELEFVRTVTNALATADADTLLNLEYFDVPAFDHIGREPVFAKIRREFYLDLFGRGCTGIELERVDPNAPGITIRQDGEDKIVESLPVRWILTVAGHDAKLNAITHTALKAGLYDGKIRTTMPYVPSNVDFGAESKGPN